MTSPRSSPVLLPVVLALPALALAVARHRAYWAAQDEDADRFDGLLALGPLAQACLARDMGLEVGVRSDYLPRSVIEAGAGTA